MKTPTLQFSRPGWVIGIAATLLSVTVGTILAQNYVASADAGHAHSDSSEVAGTASLYPVVTVFKPVAAEELENGVEASGEILPTNKADVYPMREGKIKELLVDVGSEVKAGQVIGYLTPDLEQNKLAAEAKVKKAELDKLRKELDLVDNESAPIKDKLVSGATFAEQSTTITADIQNQLTAEYDTKILVAEAAIAAAEQETGSNIAKIDVQKQQLLSEIDTKLDVNNKAIASLQKEEEANLKKVDAQINGLQQQTGQQGASQSISSIAALNDLIDIFGDMFYTQPTIIRSPNRFNSNFQRGVAYQLSNNEYHAFIPEMSQFVGKVLALKDDTDLLTIKDLNAQGLSVGKKARDLLSRALMTPEEIADIRADLDTAIEHLNEVASSLATGSTSLTTTSAELEAEKQRIKVEIEQRRTTLEGENAVLINNKNQILNLEADQKVLTVSKEQRLRELRGEVENLKKEKLRVLAEQGASTNEQASSLNDLQKELGILMAETEIKKTRGQMEMSLKSAEIAAIEGQIGAGEAIIAPFSGVITKRYLNKGDSTSLEKPVFAMINDNQKFIRFFMSEADRSFAQIGKEVRFSPTSAPTEKYTAKILRISQEVDKETRTILVEASINGDSADLLTQMTVRATVPVSDASGMVAVPEQALEMSEDKDTVWIVTTDIKADKRSVKVANTKNGYAFISAGITSQDWVIIKSPVDLKPGLEIETKK